MQGRWARVQRGRAFLISTEEDGEDVVGPAGLEVRDASSSSRHTCTNAQTRAAWARGQSLDVFDARAPQKFTPPAADGHSTTGGTTRDANMGYLHTAIPNPSCTSLRQATLARRRSLRRQSSSSVTNGASGSWPERRGTAPQQRIARSRASSESSDAVWTMSRLTCSASSIVYRPVLDRSTCRRAVRRVRSDASRADLTASKFKPSAADSKGRLHLQG